MKEYNPAKLPRQEVQVRVEQQNNPVKEEPEDERESAETDDAVDGSMKMDMMEGEKFDKLSGWYNFSLSSVHFGLLGEPLNVEHQIEGKKTMLGTFQLHEKLWTAMSTDASSASSGGSIQKWKWQMKMWMSRETGCIQGPRSRDDHRRVPFASDAQKTELKEGAASHRGLGMGIEKPDASLNRRKMLNMIAPECHRTEELISE